MNKILIGVGSILFLFFVARLTGILQWYSIPSSGNEPTIEVESTVWATNLITPKRLDFVAFEWNENGKTEIWLKRLCGLPGETIEIKDGIFYADGENYDQELILNKSYYGIGKSAIDFARRKKLDPGNDYFESPFSDTVYFYLTEDQVRNEIEIFRTIEIAQNPEIEKLWNKSWTTDDFGPIKIPANHCFVMGDNRNASRDSRHVGFLNLDNIVGVVF
jgi:signal peptidase I